MVNQILASFAIVATLLGSVGSVSVLAQTPPASAPAPAAEGTVNQDELKRFASAVKKVQVVYRDTSTEMSGAVRKEGLTEERFTEIHQARKDPAAKPAKAITPDEQKQYERAYTQLTQIQTGAREKIAQAVQTEGMNMDRFLQVMQIVQGNPQLQQQVRDMLK
jgi:hypothetical protein